MEKINYQGWPNCYRLFNECIELIATTDIGPRIIRFGFVGQQNEFAEFAHMIGRTGGNEWRGYGGHRLWHAPEAQPRSYIPDNEPITIEQHDDFIRLIQPMETGKLADMIIVAGNPAIKISDTRNIKLVMKDGRILIDKLSLSK